MRTKKTVGESFYLRDRWIFANGVVGWARRGDSHTKLSAAKAEAKRMAKGIGKGACVQVVRVRSEVVDEVLR